MTSEFESPHPAMAEYIRRELGDETIVWAGRPRRWDYVPDKLGALTAVVIVLILAIIFVTGSHANQLPLAVNDILFTTFFGLVAGLGLATFCVKLWRAKYVYYVVTTRRAVIFERNGNFSSRSYTAGDFATLDRESDGTSRGTIVFHRDRSSGGKRGYTTDIGFAALDNFTPAMAALERLIVDHERASPTSAPWENHRPRDIERAPRSLADIVDKELNGERVLWAGRPSMRGHAVDIVSSAVFFIFFSTWLVLLLLVPIQFLVDEGGSWLIAAICAFSILTGINLGLTIHRARSIYFVVTPNRAIVFERKPGSRIHSFDRRVLRTAEYSPQDSQRGDIVFQRIYVVGAKSSTHLRKLGFLGLKDFRGAKAALMEIAPSEAWS